ncbi:MULTISPECIES: AmmeMemoRadiSam system protein B [unclassified Halanaerobium]|uniref:AmmeMemoRadiSam system protein B n=1 Tax=unclassified Halanaerobium TaxID=2641197 RepID=UPI000DF3490D|nr:MULTISPECIES: AmmeMemoRadiSam system protein B [unclassified Halanaerobium]RCW49281.1 AmmeMemoRadiSam system protein B [Halanaerobium sp. MA284_MarDTE_T2]RCW84020.1 AmmeMemoRadiSam system protein B [Halanaerobium sp. DL-01]
MTVKCTALLPHPPIIIPEIGGRELDNAEKTVDGVKKTAAKIAKTEDLDLLITISPHGPVFKSHAAVIIKESLFGSFKEFGKPSLKFKEKSDIDFSHSLVNNAEKKGLNLAGLEAEVLKKYGIEEELDHGILVPWYYLKQAGLDLPIIPITIGFISYSELFKIGKIIAETAEQMDYNITVLASGDLSHRLKRGAPAGYHPDGEVFDKILIDKLKTKKFKEVLEINKKLIENAGECGLRPIIMMLGSIENKDVDVDFYSYEGPFGVGYAELYFQVK